MAFDIKTARPINTLPTKKGFDITTARPIDESIPETVTPKTGIMDIIRGARGLHPLGFIPTTNQELTDIPKVLGRQVIQGSRGGEANFKNQGPMGIGLNMAGIKETKPLIPEPQSRYGKNLENSADIAQLALAGITLSPVAKNAYNAYKLNKIGGPEGALKKAEDSLIQILQPKATRLDIASKKGLDSPDFIKKTLPFVKPSKTYDELASNLGTSKKLSMKARNQILRSDNYRIGDEYLTPLIDEINALKRQPQTQSTLKEIEDMQTVLDSYKKYNQEKGFNRVQAQAHKEILQRKTESLLKKSAKGLNIQTSPHEIKALDKVRFGLKTMIEGGNAEVKRYNEAFAGLMEAEEMARHQANLARKTNPTLLEKVPILKDVLQAVARSRAYPEQVALRALNNEPSLAKKTKEIAKLYELAAKKQTVNPPIMPIISKSSLASELATKKQLNAPNIQKALPVSSGFGEGFERVPKEEAIKRIQDFAFKYFKPNKPDIKIPFISPKFNKVKTIYPAKTAYQVALERLKKK